MMRLNTWILAALTVAGCLPAAAQGTNSAKSVDFLTFKLITERNIFDPNRRPVRRNNPSQERTAVDSFTLTGTLSYSNTLLAVFDGTKPDYHKALKESELIAGYAVSAISYGSVKLSLGTNQWELKVGMQMRRSEDGKWSVSETSGSYGSSGSSYASNSRRKSSDRRQSNSDRSSANSNGSTGQDQPTGGADNQGSSNTSPDAASGSEMETPTPPPPDAAAGDPNDPVARMMQRRLQETGRNQSGAPDGNNTRNDSGNNSNSPNQ